MKRTTIRIDSGKHPLVFELRLYKDRAKMFAGTNKYYKKHFGTGPYPTDEAMAWVQLEPKRGRIGWAVFNEKDLEIDSLELIAHEAYHLVEFYARTIGKTMMKWKHSEQYAELIGAIVQQIHNQLEEWKK